MATLGVVLEGNAEGGGGSREIELPLAEGENLLGQLLRNGIPLAHDCGGKLACASCAVIVREGFESLSAANDDERDMLDKANIASPGSRLACQALAGNDDLVIAIAARDALPSPAAPRGMVAPIVVTERAARHFAAQLANCAGAEAVRLGVQPAGCSGFRYRVDFAESIEANDTVFEASGVRIVVDCGSLPFVQGSRVDIAAEGLDRRLRFDNPNARQTCGCGESFGT